MNRKCFHLVLGGVLALAVQTASAQEPPPGPPPGPEMGGPGGPIGPRMELLGFGDFHAGKVVTGAPYSAVGITETKQTLADGNTIGRKVQSNVYRDSQGRTRHETTFPGASLASGDQPRTTVMIHDPVAGAAYILHLDQKTAEQLPSRHPGANTRGNLQSRFEAHIQQEIASGTLKKEDLGTQTINGVSAQGTRYTRIIPAGQIGNANSISIVNEQWYSPDLQVIVKTTRTDPRMGQTTYTLTNIQRTEPAANLFTVPAGYTVTQATGRPGHRGHGGPGAPPAASAEAPPADQ
jgi:hypothetical protein